MYGRARQKCLPFTRHRRRRRRLRGGCNLEPWCYVASLGALGGLLGALSEPFWGPFGALVGNLGDLLGRLGASGKPLGVLGLSWGPLEPSREPL